MLASRNPKLQAKIAQMTLPLAPLVHLTTGEIHPAFPGTILQYWLLTDLQLEELAHFYHQRTPCKFTQHYPKPIVWNCNSTLEEKRRRWGRFMGLRGCDTPPAIKTEEEIWEEARRARLVDEDEMWKRKGMWY
jgi:hypothetical protein